MQIIVLGAGAIGSLFGARLAAAHDVLLVGREEHVRAIRSGGLRIEGLEPQTVRVRAAVRVEQIEADALILLTTKVPATRAALAPLADLIREDTTIISLQNGLGSEVVAVDALQGRGVVLRGLTQAGAIFAGPGVVQFMAAGDTLLEDHPRSAHLAEILTAAGLPCHVSADIVKEVWRKLIFNCVVNPITAILGSEVGAIADSKLDPLKQLVIEECLAVAAAEGICFEVDFLREIRAQYAGSRNIVSLRQDILRGRLTEIDYLNGAIVGLAAKHHLAAPVNSGLTSIIKAMEQHAIAPRENARAAGD